MVTEIKENNYSRSKNKVLLILLVIYTLILIVLYYYLLKLKFNPLITFFLILFLFLIVLGPFLKRTKGTMYSRMPVQME